MPTRPAPLPLSSYANVNSDGGGSLDTADLAALDATQTAWLEVFKRPVGGFGVGPDGGAQGGVQVNELGKTYPLLGPCGIPPPGNADNGIIVALRIDVNYVSGGTGGITYQVTIGGNAYDIGTPGSLVTGHWLVSPVYVLPDYDVDGTKPVVEVQVYAKPDGSNVAPQQTVYSCCILANTDTTQPGPAFPKLSQRWIQANTPDDVHFVKTASDQLMHLAGRYTRPLMTRAFEAFQNGTGGVGADVCSRYYYVRRGPRAVNASSVIQPVDFWFCLSVDDFAHNVTYSTLKISVGGSLQATLNLNSLLQTTLCGTATSAAGPFSIPNGGTFSYKYDAVSTAQNLVWNATQAALTGVGATFPIGSSAGGTFTVTINGTGYNVTIPNSASEATILSAINTAIGSAGTAADASGQIKITSSVNGTASTIVITDNAVANTLGFSVGHGNESSTGTLSITVNGGSPTTIPNSGSTASINIASMTAAQVVAAVGLCFPPGVTLAASGSALQLISDTTGAASMVEITSAAPDNLGFTANTQYKGADSGWVHTTVSTGWAAETLQEVLAQTQASQVDGIAGHTYAVVTCHCVYATETGYDATDVLAVDPLGSGRTDPVPQRYKQPWPVQNPTWSPDGYVNDPPPAPAGTPIVASIWQNVNTPFLVESWLDRKTLLYNREHEAIFRTQTLILDCPDSRQTITPVLAGTTTFTTFRSTLTRDAAGLAIWAHLTFGGPTGFGFDKVALTLSVDGGQLNPLSFAEFGQFDPNGAKAGWMRVEWGDDVPSDLPVNHTFTIGATFADLANNLIDNPEGVTIRLDAIMVRELGSDGPEGAKYAYLQGPIGTALPANATTNVTFTLPTTIPGSINTYAYARTRHVRALVRLDPSSNGVPTFSATGVVLTLKNPLGVTVTLKASGDAWAANGSYSDDEILDTSPTTGDAMSSLIGDPTGTWTLGVTLPAGAPSNVTLGQWVLELR